jgi:hypothetical protein
MDDNFDVAGAGKHKYVANIFFFMHNIDCTAKGLDFIAEQRRLQVKFPLLKLKKVRFFIVIKRHGK